MSSPTTLTPTAVGSVPLWAWAVLALSLFTVYLLVQENGTLLSAGAAHWLHEVTHDGRHALGVPCH
ncbi:MAG: CbtB-domain containing protein [Nocardioides sp.]|uniref:CbtB domain-containing protein n=1 Tax=Nocardioides sp. TaxID=35761 RepID=UPI0039E62321